MADTSAEAPRPTAPNPVETTDSTANSARQHGHEQLPFVQPSTFLQPRIPTRAMPEKPITQIDKDQQAGLVSGILPEAQQGTAIDKEACCETIRCVHLADMDYYSKRCEISCAFERVMTFCPSPTDLSSSTRTFW